MSHLIETELIVRPSGDGVYVSVVAKSICPCGKKHCKRDHAPEDENQ